MERGRGRVGPQATAWPPELFSWRRRWVKRKVFLNNVGRLNYFINIMYTGTQLVFLPRCMECRRGLAIRMSVCSLNVYHTII